MGIKMDTKTFARRVRHHDWTAPMSDSWAVARRGREGRQGRGAADAGGEGGRA